MLGTVLAIPTHVWFLEPIMALDGNEKSAIVSDSKSKSLRILEYLLKWE